MHLPKEDPARLLTVILYGGVAVAAVYVFFKYLFSVLMPFALGLLLALALRPAMRLIRFRTNLSRKITAALLVSVCGAFVFFVLYLISARFYREGRELASRLSADMSGTAAFDSLKSIPIISSFISGAESAGIDLLKTLGRFFEERVSSCLT